MLESPQSGSRDHEVPPDDSDFELASSAFSALSQPNVSEAINVTAAHVLALHDAALNLLAESFVPVLEAMHADRITDQQIADHYLPAVARQLGEEWCDDQKSFAEVTIGVARLQRLLHDLGPEWRADVTDDGAAPAVLLLTGPSADHTFGAKIIAGQLRRHGLSVRLAVGLRPDQVTSLISTAPFDAVMISASPAESLAALRGIVNALKAGDSRGPPIVIGGGICASGTDIKTATGADYVTSDIGEAIRLCGLQVRNQNQTIQSKRDKS